MNNIIIPEHTDLHEKLLKTAQNADMAFFVGLPGVGKSLLLQQLTHMATNAGRSVHLLQWDVTRDPFETPEMLAKYPEIDGVTHAMIRKAVGLWARDAIAIWSKKYTAPSHMLIGELPLIGNRLMEPVQRLADDIEPLLSSNRCMFLLPVPSNSVRELIVSKRESTIAQPQHEKETKDAPPNVLRDLWRDLYHLAHQLNILEAPPEAGLPAYRAEIYRDVYLHLLKYRHSVVLNVDTALKPPGSAYDLPKIAGNLVATAEQVQEIMNHLEAEFTPEQVEKMVSEWYSV